MLSFFITNQLVFNFYYGMLSIRYYVQLYDDYSALCWFNSVFLVSEPEPLIMFTYAHLMCILPYVIHYDCWALIYWDETLLNWAILKLRINRIYLYIYLGLGALTSRSISSLEKNLTMCITTASGLSGLRLTFGPSELKTWSEEILGNY
jgi:hypothetical protein